MPLYFDLSCVRLNPIVGDLLILKGSFLGLHEAVNRSVRISVFCFFVTIYIQRERERFVV